MKQFVKYILSKIGIDAEKFGKVLDFISAWLERLKTVIGIGFILSIIGHYIGCHEYNIKNEEHKKILKDKDDSLNLYKKIIKLNEIKLKYKEQI